jgi:hypothetical protein
MEKDMTETVVNGEVTESQTFGEWVATLLAGSVIAMDEGDDYIWAQVYTASGDAMLLNKTRGWHVTMPLDEPQGTWSQVLNNETCEPEIVAPDRVRQTSEHLITLKNRDAEREGARHERNRLEARILDLETKIDEQQTDWDRLNEHLNTYAINERMCSDYERELEDWNASFTHLRLLGRAQEYVVPVRITAQYTGTVRVTTRDGMDVAVDMVNEMDRDELLQKSGHAIVADRTNYNSIEWEVSGETFRA